MASSRALSIDVVRGVAVVAMILSHSNDAWLAPTPDTRWLATLAWGFGGFAAPAFCMLMAVSATLNPPKTGYALRGANLAASGYALNAFGWLLEFWRTTSVLPALGIAVGAALLFWASRERGRLLPLALGLALFMLGASTVPASLPRAALLRVDVLHALGIALWVAGVVARSFAPLSWAPVLLALTIAAAVPSVSGEAQRVLPLWVADYLTPREGPDDYALFRLFPFAAYAVLAVSATHIVLALRRDPGDVRARRLAAFVLVVTTPIHLVSETAFGDHHHLHCLVFFALILGLALVAAELVGRPGWLQRLGRHSLFAYIAHIEIVYSSLSWRLHHRLHPMGWLIANAVLMGAIVVASRQLDRLRLRR